MLELLPDQAEPDWSAEQQAGQRKDDETPVDKAVRLVRGQLERVESRNQLVTYLKALQVSRLMG